MDADVSWCFVLPWMVEMSSWHLLGRRIACLWPTEVMFGDGVGRSELYLATKVITLLDIKGRWMLMCLGALYTLGWLRCHLGTTVGQALAMPSAN